MNTLKLATLALLCLASTGFAELLENGNFAKGVNHWRVAKHQHYGFETKADVEKGELSLSGLRKTKSSYFSINQAVLIEKDKSYTITYEIKGPSGSGYAVRLGDSESEMMDGKKFTLKTDSWEKGSLTLKAESSTESKWYKAWHSAQRKNKLEKGRTPNPKKKVEPKKKGIGSATYLRFVIGEIEGHVALRNISAVEVK